MAENNQKFAHDYTGAVFVAVGGCGMSTVSRLRKSGIRGSKTVCISRFKEELYIKGEDVVNFALLGRNVDSEHYERSKTPVSPEECIDVENYLKEAFKGTKKVLIFAGLGGFTGSAIVPVAAAIAKAEGAMLGMVITYPFKLERKRTEMADKALSGLSELADDFILRRNNDLVEMCPKLPMNEAFGRFDMKLGEEIRRGHDSSHSIN